MSSIITSASLLFSFFFNDTATTEIYTLSLHDALPIFNSAARRDLSRAQCRGYQLTRQTPSCCRRSEEHTSELQSHSDLVCRLLLEKKKEQCRKRARLRIQHRPGSPGPTDRLRSTSLPC